jgi:FMN-dependent NADH-azoreductase
MPTVLVINASARQSRSISRALAAAFQRAWQQRFPASRIIDRDVGRSPPAIISQCWIDAAFTRDASRTAEQRHVLSESDVLIDEVADADVIVVATPMYNYGMPAALKAWFDQVIRINRTFDFDLARGDYPLRATMAGKVMVLLTSSGEFGFAAGAEREREGHLLPHLQTVSRYLGVERHHHVGVEYQEFGDARHEESKSAAFAAIPGTVAAIGRQLRSTGQAVRAAAPRQEFST